MNLRGVPPIHLTARERQVLEYLATDEGDGDLVWANPGGWWFGTEQLGGKTGLNLIRKILVSESSAFGTNHSRGSTTYYRINEEGQKALADPSYVPEVFRVKNGPYARELAAAGITFEPSPR